MCILRTSSWIPQVAARDITTCPLRLDQFIIVLHCMNLWQNERRGSQNWNSHCNFANVEPIRVSIVSVLALSSSVLDDPAKSRDPVLVDRNELILQGVTEKMNNRINEAISFHHANWSPFPFQINKEAKVTERYSGAIGKIPHSHGTSCVENFLKMPWIVNGCFV
jgi:hypothetical protein